MLRSTLVPAALSIVCLVAPAQAGDVKLLKQPSTFPLVISQPGSYRLKSNITVPNANTTAIRITADDVTLDLNGYAIIGPEVCSGTPVTSCTPTGNNFNANGIDSIKDAVTVINGTVRGMGAAGVFLGNRARVERVRAISNTNVGIAVGVASSVVGSTAMDNGYHGIQAEEGTIVSGNTSRGNGCDGIFVSNGSTVVGNSATVNGCYGLDSAGDSGYANNVFHENAWGSVSPSGTDMGHNDCNGSTTCP